MLVLENMDSALARGATVFGEIAGFGMSSDAHHITQPSARGPVRAMRAALADAGLDRVDYINAHGTGTAANDVTETAAIRSCSGIAGRCELHEIDAWTCAWRGRGARGDRDSAHAA